MSLIKEYIQAVLESYIMENDFMAATGKATPAAKGMQTPAQPQKFDMNTLKGLNNLVQVQNYANSTLRVIGEGQGRKVYTLGNGNVLKVAKNEAGTAQNKAEATVCTGTDPDLFPRVQESGSAYMWLIMEEAAPMNPTNFAQLTGLEWKNFSYGLAAAFPDKVKQVTPTHQAAFQVASNNPFFRKIVDVIKKCTYEPGDIAKLDSWGVVNGKPVIIDSGFTEAVNQAYYAAKATAK